MQQRVRLSFLCLTLVGLLSTAHLGCDNGAAGTGGSGTSNATSTGSPAATTSGSPASTTSTSVSTSTSTASSTSGGTTCGGGTFVDNGYVKTGPWMGYGFTVADTLGEGTTVSPTCGGSTCTPAFTGSTFSFSGSVAPDVGYAGFALLGWNLNQASAAMSAIDNWAVPASGGVTITFTNPMNAPVRLQVQEPNATTNAQRYCATLTSGVQILWSDLMSECYATPPGASLAAGTMLVNAAVQVYGGNMTAVPFNICITDITVQ